MADESLAARPRSGIRAAESNGAGRTSPGTVRDERSQAAASHELIRSRNSRSSSLPAGCALGDVGSIRPSRPASSAGDQVERGRANALVEVAGPRHALNVRRFKTRFGPSRTRSIAWTVGVEPLEVVRSLDERPLPASFEVEVIDRRIAKIERKRPLLEAGEDRISRRDKPVSGRFAGGKNAPCSSRHAASVGWSQP